MYTLQTLHYQQPSWPSTMTAIRSFNSKSKEQMLTYLWVFVRKSFVSIKSLHVRALLSRAAKANIKSKKASHDSCCCTTKFSHAQHNLEWQTSSAWKRDSGIHCSAVKKHCKTLLKGARSPHDSTALKWARMHGFPPAEYSTTWRGEVAAHTPEM